MISVVVEGDTDIPYVRKLCGHAGLDAYEPFIDRNGKSGIDATLPNWANAAKASPYLVLRDLDTDAGCAPEWIAEHAPKTVGKWFCLRIAVRAVEAWLLADATTLAKRLHIDETRVPRRPDDEADPKLTIVALARKSTKPAIRDGLVPRAGERRKVGPDYNGWLIDSGDTWSIERAMKRSPSLASAHRALVALRVAYQAFLEGA